ncbi:MAG: hypothetical protein ACK4WM_06280 [Thermoflexales bacterium]
MVAQLGVRVVVTDDLASYRALAEQSGVACRFRVQRWVATSARRENEAILRL